MSGRTAFLVAYTRVTSKYRAACALRDEGKPGPKIIAESELLTLLAVAEANRGKAEAVVRCGGLDDGAGDGADDGAVQVTVKRARVVVEVD